MVPTEIDKLNSVIICKTYYNTFLSVIDFGFFDGDLGPFSLGFFACPTTFGVFGAFSVLAFGTLLAFGVLTTACSTKESP